MRITRNLIVAAAALVLAVGPGCVAADSTTGEAGVADGAETTSADTSNGTLLIGSVASLTGSAEPYGAGQQRGTTLAVEDLNGRGLGSITLESRDDASTPATGAEAFSELIEQGVAAILGPTLSPVAETADPLAQAVGVPVLAVSNTTLDIGAIGDAVWRVTLSERAMLPQGLEATRDLLDLSTVALVSDRVDGYSRGAADAFRNAIDQAGLELVADVEFDPEGLDEAGYQALLRTATEQAPDAVLFAARSTPASSLLAAAAALGLPQARIGSNGFNSPEVLAAAGPAAEGLIVTASWNAGIDVAASRAFVDRYTGRFGVAPDAFAAQAYAGVEILVAAAQAGGGTSRQAITNGLQSLEGVDTVLGTVRFADNEAVYPAAIQVVRGGGFELLARGTP